MGNAIRSINARAGDAIAVVRLQDGQVCTVDLGQAAPPVCRPEASSRIVRPLSGTTLLSMLPDTGVLQVTRPDGTATQRLTPPSGLPFDLVRFDHSGRRIATAASSLDGKIFVLDLGTGPVTWQSKAAAGMLKSVVFDPSGRLLVALCDKGAKVLDVAGAGDPVLSLVDTQLESAVFTPHALLLGYERGGTDAYGHQPDGAWAKLRQRGLGPEQGSVIATDRDGSLLMARRNPDGATVILSARSNDVQTVILTMMSFHPAGAFTPDGRFMALLDMIAADGSIVVRGTRSSEPAAQIPQPACAIVAQAVFLHDGRVDTTVGGHLALTAAAPDLTQLRGACGCGPIVALRADAAGQRPLAIGQQ